MAKHTITGKSLARTVRVGGRRKIGLNGRVELTVEIDGESITTSYTDATHQEAIYIATVRAMRRADADGVTSLSIDSPNNLVEGHMEKGWKRQENRFTPFQDDITVLKDHFDQVTWL